MPRFWPRFPRARTAVRSVGWTLILLILCSGITRPQHPPSTIDPGQGWVNVQAILNFTLASPTVSSDRDALAQSLDTGLRLSIAIDKNAHPISISPQGWPDQPDISMELSNTRPDLTHKPPKPNDNIKPKPGLFVHDFDLIAHPLLLGDAKVQYDLTASDASFDLIQNNLGQPALIMTGARAGSLIIVAPIDDLQSFATQQAKLLAGKWGFLIRSIRFNLKSESPRQITASIRVNFTVGIITLHGQMAIDDDMRGIASNLSCSGVGPIGLAAASLLTPALQDYEGRSRPLIEFPERKMKLRDIRVAVDQSLHISADFGSP